MSGFVVQWIGCRVPFTAAVILICVFLKLDSKSLTITLLHAAAVSCVPVRITHVPVRTAVVRARFLSTV